MELAPHERVLRLAGAVDPIGEDRFSANLSPLFTVMGHPNGGYLQCVLGSAALGGAIDAGSPHLHVTGVTTNYIAGPMIGPAELRTQVRRVGKSVTFVHVEMWQDGTLTTEALVTLGTLRDDAEPRYTDAPLPAVAARDACVVATAGEEIGMLGAVDLLLDPSSSGWNSARRSDRGEVRGWLRLNDGEGQWDPWSLLFATDALPPATLPLGSTGWVPTLQLTSYISAHPRSEWLRVRQWCVVISDGIVAERCELFDDEGYLVASASQLALVRFPLEG